MTNDPKHPIPLERIQQKILLLRGQKVMLDLDLSKFYQVSTSNLNKAVARNLNRFPEDFMFRLSFEEFKELNEQLGGDHGRGGRRTPPYAFTEQGVAMLSTVLRSDRAIAVSIQIIRSFIKLRELLLSNEDLARRMRALEIKTDNHAKTIMQIIKELNTPSTPQKRRIGF